MIGGTLASLSQQPWLAVAAAMAAFLGLFAALKVYSSVASPHPETLRKLLHTGSGLLTLSFPFLFPDVWPVLLLTTATALLLAVVKFAPRWRRRLGDVVDGVGRTTFGELYFPVAVATVFWLAHGESPLLFVIPILVLTIADATCAIVGMRYGLNPYTGGSKSLEGSVAFVVVAFFCIHVPLLLWSSVGRAEALLISATLAFIVMLLEGSAWRGLDNLFIPIGGYFILRVFLTLDAGALRLRFLVTLALVALIVSSRRRTTLEDDSLVAGAFLCYVTWALMGWRWLVAPIIVFVGYAWLSPRTALNSRRIHDVPAMLSVWAAAIVWVVLGHSATDHRFVYPFTVVFAAHLAMFGTSRLASQFPARPLAMMVSRAVVLSWVIVFVPFVLAQGPTRRTAAQAVLAIVAIALGAVAFVTVQPAIRQLPVTAIRWVRQAACAAVASMVAWALAVAAEWVGL